MIETEYLLIVLIIIFIYFIPTYKAYQRSHNNSFAIFVCNVLLGWTFLGWIITLIWACTDNIEYKNYKYIKK